MVHRGIKIERRGKRYRFRLRTGSRLRAFSFLSLEETLSALDDELDRRTAAQAATIARRINSVTVEDLCRRWFEDAQARYSPGGRRNYETAIRLHIAPSALSTIDANTVTAQDLREFYRTLRFGPAKKAHQVLRHAFRWARDAVPQLTRRDNPALQVAPVRKECIGYDGIHDYDEDEIRPVDEKNIPTPAEVEKLLIDAASRDRRWWLYLVLAVATGARPGEICALQRRHIDLERSEVRIAWSADRVSGKIKRPKTRWSIRSVPLPTELSSEIAGSLPEHPDDFLFEPDQRSPMPCWNGRGVYRRMVRATRVTGLPRYTPHALRHYHATRLLAEGEPPTQVARRLGHKDDTLIRKLYGRHIDDDAQRRLAERSIRHLFGEGYAAQRVERPTGGRSSSGVKPSTSP